MTSSGEQTPNQGVQEGADVALPCRLQGDSPKPQGALWAMLASWGPRGCPLPPLARGPGLSWLPLRHPGPQPRDNRLPTGMHLGSRGSRGSHLRPGPSRSPRRRPSLTASASGAGKGLPGPPSQHVHQARGRPSARRGRLCGTGSPSSSPAPTPTPCSGGLGGVGCLATAIACGDAHAHAPHPSAGCGNPGAGLGRWKSQATREPALCVGPPPFGEISVPQEGSSRRLTSSPGLSQPLTQSCPRSSASWAHFM